MKRLVACAGVLLCCACQSAPADFAHARLTNATPDQQAELTQLMARATGRAQVNLADDAFAASHILVLEPALARTPQGTVATGRTTTKPHTFHLLSDGRACVLEHVNSGQRYRLSFSCNKA